MNTPPLILTLTLNPEAQAFFTDLRTQHFPPARNFLPAHLTLFHHLPFGQSIVLEVLSNLCRQQRPMSLWVADLMFLGSGVAYKIESAELQQLHRHLQSQWQAFLIPQDQQKLRPHITVQNKVKPETARALESRLRETFQPFGIRGTGLTLWKYQGGPWEFYQAFDFLNQED